MSALMHFDRLDRYSYNNNVVKRKALLLRTEKTGPALPIPSRRAGTSPGAGSESRAAFQARAGKDGLSDIEDVANGYCDRSYRLRHEASKQAADYFLPKIRASPSNSSTMPMSHAARKLSR